MDRKIKIVFIVQYPKGISPGQRFRFELYKDLLEEHNFIVETHPFLDWKGYNVIHKKGHFLSKGWAVLRGYAKRISLAFYIRGADFVFLQREAALLGPPIFEWIYARLLKRKIIYDFDDAIWISHISDGNSLFLSLKWVSKVKSICRWSYKISAGNEYLCEYARKYNNNVIYNPTCVDTDKRHNILASHDKEIVTIGWTGSFSTLKYMDMLQPVLKQLQNKYKFNIKIICNEAPNLDLDNVEYIPWSIESEIKELASCQIGLMPLTDDEWSKGKCGFKLIQYLSLEIPAVASPIGVNPDIIDNGINGYLCKNENEWYEALEKLLVNPELRKKMGRNGREKIVAEYSLKSNSTNFLSLFS